MVWQFQAMWRTIFARSSFRVRDSARVFFSVNGAYSTIWYLVSVSIFRLRDCFKMQYDLTGSVLTPARISVTSWGSSSAADG